MFGNFSRMPPGCDPCDLGLVEDRHRLRVSAQRKGVVWSTVPTCLGAVYEQHVTWVFWRYMPKKAVKMKGLGRKGPFFSDQLHPGQWDRSMSMPLTGSGWVDGVHSDCMACIRGDVSEDQKVGELDHETQSQQQVGFPSPSHFWISGAGARVPTRCFWLFEFESQRTLRFMDFTLQGQVNRYFTGRTEGWGVGSMNCRRRCGEFSLRVRSKMEFLTSWSDGRSWKGLERQTSATGIHPGKEPKARGQTGVQTGYTP